MNRRDRCCILNTRTHRQRGLVSQQLISQEKLPAELRARGVDKSRDLKNSNCADVGVDDVKNCTIFYSRPPCRSLARFHHHHRGSPADAATHADGVMNLLCALIARLKVTHSLTRAASAACSLHAASQLQQPAGRGRYLVDWTAECGHVTQLHIKRQIIGIRRFERITRTALGRAHIFRQRPRQNSRRAPIR